MRLSLLTVHVHSADEKQRQTGLRDPGSHLGFATTGLETLGKAPRLRYPFSNLEDQLS